MGGDPISLKISRLRAGEAPRVLDLFSGCGGISLGFQAAGFEISGAVEIDPDAALSHAENFHPSPDAAFRIHSMPWDITVTEPEELARAFGLGDVAGGIDVIVGGPPCQAFARVGRAKLREVRAHPEAFMRDGRGGLYRRYLHYVRAFRPAALMLENVPDALNYGGHNIAGAISEALGELGYVSRYALLNAVHYGVPQMRERMFLVAFARGLSPGRFFPAPTRRHELPKGYGGSRQVALKALNADRLSLAGGRDSGFVQAPGPGNDLPPAVTAREAIGDLPPVTLHLEGRLRRGARRLDAAVPYPRDAELRGYARQMRTWNGFEGSEGIVDHVIRHLPRDYDIFERMKPGDQYPEAYQAALAIFRERLQGLREAGKAMTEGGREYGELFAGTVPPYSPDKFPNKWRKMEADEPARTLMAHLGKDGYSHIHYDSRQKRTISVREAARLQSFPDGFRFHGTMNPAFRQIGNAVPPLMAKAIAEAMASAWRAGDRAAAR
ncbi:MAG: DNA cytosine methyltransferase [Deltaproteobacteria bacterium]|nr:DNA cytosine methyltransferase [Deltaproteobacteria bacterium]